MGLLFFKDNKIVASNPFACQISSPFPKDISQMNILNRDEHETSPQLSDLLTHALEKSSQHTTLMDLVKRWEGSQKYEGQFELDLTPAGSVPENQSQEDGLILGIKILCFNEEDGEYKVCMMSDETNTEKLMKERVTLEHQQRFFAMITHELRGPLQGILGVMELIREEHKEMADIRNQMTLGLNSGNLMLVLINDILDFSQMAANKFQIVQVSYSPEDACKECLGMQKYRFEKKGVRLLYQHKSEIPATIKNDQNRMKQIIINLLSNALKFTPQNGQVTISMKYNKANCMLSLKVADTGIGISPEDQKKLFEAFGKLSHSSLINTQGVGLGLFICKKLSEAMGGDISLKSVLRKGATFKVRILDYGGSEQQEEASKELKLNSLIHTKKPCNCVDVLIVEDDALIAQILSSFATNLGYYPDIACNGAEGVKRVMSSMERPCKVCKGIKAIFLDQNMPVMTGAEAAPLIIEEFRKRELTMPILVGMSADNTESAKEAWRSASVNIQGKIDRGEFLLATKPISLENMKLILSGV